MVLQFTIGAVIIFVSVCAKSALIGLLLSVLKAVEARRTEPRTPLEGAVLVGAVSLWMLAAQAVAIWIWAVAFYGLGIFTEFETALYFSGVAFTTLGFGDITLPPEWRQLAGLCAANGLLIFGISSALLVEVLRRLTTNDGDLDA